MSENGTPFFPGEYKRWNFSDFHPRIEKLDMDVIHWQGSPSKVGQVENRMHFSERDMPEKLFCSACEYGGQLDLSGHVKNLEYGLTTENTALLNCPGTIGRSKKGQNPGQECSWSQFKIETKIVYKS